MTKDDATGFNAVPQRYNIEGREAIDIMRDRLGDEAFIAYCEGNAIKYRLREGKKDSPDAEKARWYEEMAAHVRSGTPDPRSNRPGFKGYSRSQFPLLQPERLVNVLDHGFVRFVESWGHGDARMPEAGIIEAARQSTQGTFRGWRREQRLLQYLYEKRHSTPFEFAGMVLEIRAPIFIFREWHRHRTQSYNEMSARYTKLPDLNYKPTLERVMLGAEKTVNKQAGTVEGSKTITEVAATEWLHRLQGSYDDFERKYQLALEEGVPKELARLDMPIGRYTQMRASANLRNWLAFLTLRMDPNAQWEIRQYANAVYDLVVEEFPRTAALFREGQANL